MAPPDPPLDSESSPSVEERAAQAFLRAQAGDTAGEIRPGISDAAPAEGADARRRVEQAWQVVGEHAASAQLMALREQALTRAREASARNHRDTADRPHFGFSRRELLAAGIAGFGLVTFSAWFALEGGHSTALYQTDIGEQRMLELEDGSRVSLDASSDLQVDFTRDARVVRLREGQAYFDVAKEARRPFRVEMGGHTVVAVGTAFNAEYLNQQMRVTMVEGRVAVSVDAGQGPQARTGRNAITELAAGQELRVAADGRTMLDGSPDLEAATAWRRGTIVFRAETLAAAVARLNRYSRLQLEVRDATLSAMQVSGVFEVGDVEAFTEAIESYLPVVADYSIEGVVTLVPASGSTSAQ